VISKDMGWLMQPRYLFFGLICVPQYMYRWGLSKAYIDILFADDVITQYDTKSKHKKSSKERLEEMNNDPHGEDRAKAAMEKWYRDHPEKRPKRKVNLDELMSKSF